MAAGGGIQGEPATLEVGDAKGHVVLSEAGAFGDDVSRPYGLT